MPIDPITAWHAERGQTARSARTFGEYEPEPIAQQVVDARIARRARRRRGPVGATDAHRAAAARWNRRAAWVSLFSSLPRGLR